MHAEFVDIAQNLLDMVRTYISNVYYIYCTEDALIAELWLMTHWAANHCVARGQGILAHAAVARLLISADSRVVADTQQPLLPHAATAHSSKKR